MVEGENIRKKDRHMGDLRRLKCLLYTLDRRLLQETEPLVGERREAFLSLQSLVRAQLEVLSV